MAVLESVLVALGLGVAKYLAKEALPKDWQDQVAAELIGAAAKELSKQKEIEPVAAAIGEPLKVLYQHSTLNENEKIAVQIEVIRTLAQADTSAVRLVELDLDAEALGRALIAARSEAQQQLSAGGRALYERMLAEAGRAMMQVANRVEGFEVAATRAQLGRQRLTLELLETLAPSLASWLQEPDEQARRFERMYRTEVARTLNKMEPFGIEESDRWGDALKLSKIFVRPDLRLTLWSIEPETPQARLAAERGEDRITAREQRLDAFQALAQVERLMVVGAAGSGKSTFLQWLAICAAERTFPPALGAWNDLVPFFIRLRDYQDEGFPSPEAFVDRLLPMAKEEMPQRWVHTVLRRGQALVLVDGVDEMRREDREQMLEKLQQLASLYPLSRYVVTSRPPVVDETRWPAWHDWLHESGFAESWLPDMQWPQIEEFVERWHEALVQVVEGREAKQEATRNRGGLVALLQKQPTLRRLAGSPLLCAMICTLYQRQHDNISTERLELYRNCVEMLLWDRDRKHPRRKVPAIIDYPAFTKAQLERLLSSLAYWMMDERKSAASRERVLGQFAGYLPNLGLSADLAAQAFEYFHERADMWEEPVVGYVEFRHRTFQEYLAAGWAMRRDKVGALAEHAAEEPWRETVVLAAGAGTPNQSWALLQEILGRARAAAAEPARRYLLLLALSCLETCVELPDGTSRQTVVDQARPVFPPHTVEEAEMVARGGVYAIELLRYDPDAPGEIAAHCIAALAVIGGAKAMEAIAEYLQSKASQVERAIGDAWSHFEASAYAETVLADAKALSLSALPADPARLLLLPSLTQLDLGGTQVSDISPLAQLTSLTQIDLTHTHVSDISSLAQMTGLTQIDLGWTQVSDIGPLAQLLCLTRLELVETKVSDVSPLAHLPSLTQLGLGNTPVSDITPLTQLHSLTRLDISDLRIDDISPLAHMLSLTRLDLLGMPVSSINALAQMSNLTQLSLSWTQVSDISPLTKLRNLTELDLSWTKVSDISPLTQLTNLTLLDMRKTSVIDISPLAQLTSLTLLNLSDTQVSDLSPLAKLPNLARLDLHKTSVVDISPLAQLTSLTLLDLSDTHVSDLSPLAQLPNLARLAINNEMIEQVLLIVSSVPHPIELSIYGHSMPGPGYEYVMPG